ncbi:hypothetical protein Tco_1320928 [Tanacetum coccineum]
MIHRSCLRWKPTGKLFKTVGLRWVPTGKIFTSSTTKVDSEPQIGSNDDITHQSYALSWKPCQGDSLNLPDHRYADEPGIIRYVKIAATLGNKTVRDVALRCRWLALDVPALQACCILSRPWRLRKDLTHQNLLLDRNTLIVKIAGLGLDRVSILPIKKYNHERKRGKHEELNLWKKLKDKKILTLHAVSGNLEPTFIGLKKKKMKQVQTNLLDEEKENANEVVDDPVGED